MKKKKVLLGILIGICILLFIAHNEINTAIFFLTTNEGLVAEDIIESDSPKEVKKTVKKELKLKFLGHKIIKARSIMINVCGNPDPEVLRTILDDKDIKKALDEESKSNDNIDAGLFNFVIYSKNAPEKVKILLEHGYDPYKINTQSNKSAMDNIQKNHDKIDPNIIKIINEYYDTNKRS